jgi:hypothetical protein
MAGTPFDVTETYSQLSLAALAAAGLCPHDVATTDADSLGPGLKSALQRRRSTSDDAEEVFSQTLWGDQPLKRYVPHGPSSNE